MSDLISRQAVIEAIEQHKTDVLGEREWSEGIAYGYSAAHRHLVDVVKQLSSAQPEIIRCKDCRYNFYCGEENHIAQCERDALLRNPYFFCADGERKEKMDEIHSNF